MGVCILPFMLRDLHVQSGSSWLESQGKMMGLWLEGRIAYFMASIQHVHSHLLGKNIKENKVSGGKK